jgi:phosphoenolpyruvate carboxykinase (ATP)
LRPRGTWEDPTRYDEAARKLAYLFRDNFKQYEKGVTAEVRAAGPKI